MFRIVILNAVTCNKRFVFRPSFVRNLHSIYSTKSLPLDLAFDHYVPTNKTATLPLPPVVLSHGLFANRKIWESVSKAVSDKTNREVYSVDLRNHGDSPFCEEHFLPDITVDLEKFITRLPSPPTLVGHSLGGLCSGLLSITKPQLIKDLVMLDISPTSFPEGVEQHVIFFTRKMREVITKIPSRLNLEEAKDFVDALFQSHIPVPFVRKLLLSNLAKSKEGFKWKLNLDPIEQIFGNRKIFDLFPFKGRYDGNVTLIYGEQSPYVKLDEETEMKKIFPRMKLYGIPESTHWIYEDKPEELIKILSDVLR